MQLLPLRHDVFLTSECRKSHLRRDFFFFFSHKRISESNPFLFFFPMWAVPWGSCFTLTFSGQNSLSRVAFLLSRSACSPFCFKPFHLGPFRSRTTAWTLVCLQSPSVSFAPLTFTPVPPSGLSSLASPGKRWTLLAGSLLLPFLLLCPVSAIPYCKFHGSRGHCSLQSPHRRLSVFIRPDLLSEGMFKCMGTFALHFEGTGLCMGVQLCALLRRSVRRR